MILAQVTISGGQSTPGVFYLDARSLEWPGTSAALLAFRTWIAEHHGYLYFDSAPSLKPEVERLCSHLGIADHVCSVDDVAPEDRAGLTRYEAWPPTGGN